MTLWTIWARESHSTKSEILRKAIALFDVAAQAKQKDHRNTILVEPTEEAEVRHREAENFRVELRR